MAKIELRTICSISKARFLSFEQLVVVRDQIVGIARISEGQFSIWIVVAKDYISDKVSVVGDKIKELKNADLGELAENAKDYARTNPGQALLISAAAGLILGLVIRGRR